MVNLNEEVFSVICNNGERKNLTNEGPSWSTSLVLFINKMRRIGPKIMAALGDIIIFKLNDRFLTIRETQSLTIANLLVSIRSK